MLCLYSLFFSNATATTEIYTLSLHDALPIYPTGVVDGQLGARDARVPVGADRQVGKAARSGDGRSEEHTSELQSQFHLVCRLLLEKKKEVERRQHTHPRVLEDALEN